MHNGRGLGRGLGLGLGRALVEQDIMSYYRKQNVLYVSFSGTGHNVH